MTSWIDLAQFAAKYGVSQSTLRRRIRANTIAYKLERGKYFLQDTTEALSEAPLFARNVNHPVTRSPSQRALESTHSGHSTNSANNSEGSGHGMETVGAVEENKKLRKQLAELETFVSALEAEIRRLQNQPTTRNEFGITETF